MSKSLWQDNYSASDVFNPVSFINEQCKILSSITNGAVTARISQFDNYPEPNWLNRSLSSAIAGISPVTSPSQSVQDLLGESSSSGKFTYEFFITSNKTPKYKFRAFIIRYGLSIFPIEVDIEREIAVEIVRDFCSHCPDEDSFTGLLESILSSNRLATVIKNLLSFQ